MGFGGIGPGQLLIILLIVVIIFGTKRLRNIGSDLGGAIKGFKKSMQDEEADRDPKSLEENKGEGSPTSAQEKSDSDVNR